MKADFTRFTFDPRKHYTRVLRQQGRVDLDADWNEAIEIFTQRDRTEAIDVIGRCGVPLHDDGFKVEATADGSGLTLSPGRIYVDGILCEQAGPDPVALSEQEDLPGYDLPEDDGVYLAYLDVWDRHITALEDPEIREVALGGPDTTTRTRTVRQVRLLRIADDESLDLHDCQPYPADPTTGRMVARATPAGAPTNPCAVPEGAGYTGLENRLYRVEIHDDGRDEAGSPGARPVTFKWSRDNGSVVLPVVEENGIDGDTVSVQRLGFDEVLTVRVGDWVEISGEETELYGRPGTLGQIVPDGIDRADLEIELDRDLSAHADERRLKVRRWDHHETDDLGLVDGALPIPAGAFELEDGVVIEFEAGGSYHVGDYWLIPARTREGTVLWPSGGNPPTPLAQPPLGIDHHYCTLALVRRTGGEWVEPRDCRPFFPPLTEVGGGGCCLTVEPGGDIQQALDTVVAAGGGCVGLCAGIHEVEGPLWIRDGVDVTVHGEGGASVVRFAGTDEGGFGGFMIEHGSRIAFDDLFLTSDSVSGLITIRHGPDLEQSREIALRRLILLNLATSDDETDLACALRIGHAEGVRIDDCRIAAEVGILALWGNALLAPVGGGPNGGGEAPPLLTIGFEELELDAEIRVGTSLAASGVTISGEPFQQSNGEFTENGFARVENNGDAGGSGQDLQTNNILLDFALPVSYSTARIRFGDFGGNVNLRINGEFRNAQSVAALDGLVLGGVRVGVGFLDDDPQQEHGLLRLDGEGRDIADFALGGQELWIDDVVFRGPGDAPPQPLVDPGDGVSDLHLRGTKIRFQDVGVLAAVAERWVVEGADIAPYDGELWGEVVERFVGDPDENGGPPERLVHVLDALEDVFSVPGAPTGYGLLAYLWRDCSVRGSSLAGRHALRAWWWLRGSLEGSELVAEESGCHAFWLYEADWLHNRVETSDGLALSFGGCCRASIEGNRLGGPIGLQNLVLLDALDALDPLARALQRGYGGDASFNTVLGAMLEESFDLMGLRPLMELLQPIVDEQSPTPGLPVAYYLAPSILGMLRGQGGGTLRSLPIIDLAAVHNDIACSVLGVGFDGFLPLGSLRVATNRIHTVTGQAVRVETSPFLANAHLTVHLFRILLMLLVRMAESGREEADDEETAEILAALQELLEGWQSGAESLFDLDFRVEGNTIRSLRTAIESNLFELAVLTNHVTMQERTVAGREGPGAIFGQVLTPAGAPVPGASVRVVGTELVTITDANAGYRLNGLPAGSYTLRATAAGFAVAGAEVELSAGEQVEVDFMLQPALSVASFDNQGFSDSAIGARSAQAQAANPEILEIIEALERSSALEPLAVAMREGAHTMPEAYSGYLAADGGPLSTQAARNAAADAVTLIRGQTSDEELRVVTGQLNTALRGNDRTQLSALLLRLIIALQRYTDSQGILLRGAGVRVIENQVIVPADVDPETEALGGVQVSVNYAYVFALSLLGAFVARYLGADDNESEFDPLLGITDTLVEDNEIVGGVGHGVSVQGVAGQPDFLRDLRISGNQVRGMGGAGLLINEHALIVGLAVSHNHVSDCGRPAGFTRRKGGLLVQTAAACTVASNHVLRCGANLSGDGAWGVDLDSLYDLRFTGNEVQANGSLEGTAEDGGVRLTEVYGAALLHDNVINFNRGIGLSWVNSAREGEAALLPPFLMQAVNDYLRMSRTVGQLVAEEQASLQGNAFKSVADSDFPIFQLLNLREVLFSGNSCFAETRGAPLGEIQQTSRGVVTNNQTQTNATVAIAIKKMGGGVVLGNVGNRAIQLQVSPSVQHAYNVPAATT